jgi:hypothetical protein
MLLAILFLNQDLDFPFSIFQHLEAGFRQPDPFLKNLQRVIEGQIALLQFSDDRFQSRHGILKLKRGHTISLASSFTHALLPAPLERSRYGMRQNFLDEAQQPSFRESSLEDLSNGHL